MQEQHKKQPEISIIVPVYKTERFLSACISSILAQTFTDFELILVDDGSPDSCPALCDAAAAKDSRIRVIHQKNRGLSGARNAGLDAAEGEWIAFVDSDDMLLPQALEILARMAREQHIDADLFEVFMRGEVWRDYARRFLPAEQVDAVDVEALLRIARG